MLAGGPCVKLQSSLVAARECLLPLGAGLNQLTLRTPKVRPSFPRASVAKPGSSLHFPRLRTCQHHLHGQPILGPKSAGLLTQVRLARL